MPFLGSKYAKIAFAAGALPRTMLGELTALPRPPSWIKGDLLLRGGEGTGGKGEGKVAPPFLKFVDPPPTMSRNVP